jgi:hypothetical protein
MWPADSAAATARAAGAAHRRRAPVAHDDVAAARHAAASVFAGYGELPNYRRILDIGGAPDRLTPRSSATNRL